MLRKVFIFLGLVLAYPLTGHAVIHNISIQGFDFVPGNQTINQGDTIRWTNNDGAPHTSTSDGGLWNSGTLTTGQSYIRAFSSTGTFPYHCAIHTSMKDTLTVVAVATYDTLIEIGDNFFNPAVIQINAGQTIRWVNNGAMAHTTTAGDGLWDSGNMNSGETFDFTFASEAVHDYVCTFHPGMVGTVIVGRPDSVVADITIIDMAFDPADLEITVGQYVRWINFDSMPHTTTENGGYWDSGNMDSGDVFTFRADSVGVFDYICSYHPSMTGVLRVDPVIDYEVMIFDNYFDPAIIHIQPGQTVRWMNMGNRDHTTTSLDGFWDSGMLSTGQMFFYTFNDEGVFDYRCEMHPLTMLGTVVVGKPDSVAFGLLIGDNFYAPAETTITIGENIRWINMGAMGHTVTDTSADHFDSGSMAPGDVFTWHADSAGVYHYICTFHPGMFGTLTVLDTTTNSGCPYVLGDINGNGAANGIDVTYGVSYFKGGNVPPISCDCGVSGILYAAGDVNGNCVFNGIDITYYVGYLKGGAGLQPCANCPPSPPFNAASIKTKTVSIR